MLFIYWVKMHLSPYVYAFLLYRPMQCTSGLFSPSEHIAWQQEEAPCGGPFMSEAVIFEWTAAPPPAKHKHLTIERIMRKRLTHSTVHDSMSLLFL